MIRIKSIMQLIFFFLSEYNKLILFRQHTQATSINPQKQLIN